ncbi:MAG: DUF4062 domain-containing protein [Prevotellaceae bacterium]|jgi:dCMP deaminase|nr:DUF4062 domain-containing protein [Prevotellaceae bacterium]
MDNKLQIFISSTYTDLIEERQAAVMAILEAEHIPAGMELFAAGDKSQLDSIKKWIDESDVYMLILGGRYGSIEPESGLSYTEVEYRYAVEKKKPLFAVILNEKWLEEKSKATDTKDIYEFENQVKYKDFQKLVNSKLCAICKDKSQLQKEIIKSLNKQKEKSLTGWIKASDIHKMNISIASEEKDIVIIDPTEKNETIKSLPVSKNEPHVIQTPKKNSVIDVLFQKNKEFIIIGLTGRTGSGCSTIANLLSSDNLVNKDKREELLKTKSNEERKYSICYNYLAKNWEMPAILVKITHLILLLCLKDGFNNFLNQIRNWVTNSYNIQKHQMETELTELKRKKQDADKKDDKDNMEKSIELGQEIVVKEELLKKNEKSKNTRIRIIENVEKILPEIKIIRDMERNADFVYESLRNKSQSYRNRNITIERDAISNFLGTKENKGEIEDCYSQLKNKLDKSFVSTFQLFGNYIRYSTFFERNEDESPYSITSLLHHVIQYYRNINTDEDKSTLIVIDSLRNPYEIFYLRKKYSSFYAMAVSARDDNRRNRLIDKNYDKKTIEEFNETEFPSQKVSLRDKFIYQNINECAEISDIHIINNDKKVNEDGNETNGLDYLQKQLIRYVSLMKHPALVIPTHEERTMQIAFMAKSNSGCISRQVGAVITDKDFAIKTIGWNTAPEGQVPCLLRDCYTLLETKNEKKDLKALYSEYEVKQREKNIDKPDEKTLCDCLTEKFGTDKSIFNGRNVSYCFKDVFNKQKGEKNQVHTRALHAEENAFLQITKHGGQSIKGGKLFTTASPCELCAKKAYQLGIKEIYYIDLYPGISQEHILESGKNECRPKMIFFEGAIGRAYLQLYQPIISYKDEINDILDSKKNE